MKKPCEPTKIYISPIPHHHFILLTMRPLLLVLPSFALLVLLLHLSHLHSTPADTDTDTAPRHQRFRILIGILTRADLYAHRNFLRLVYNTQSSPTADIDVKFVFCRLTKDEQRVLVALEILRFDDIIILNCTENMNAGKTYTYFSSLPSALPRRYDYVMKADDDAFVRLEPLAASLNALRREDLYYGFVIPCASANPFADYMSGMGYVLSWDLVEWISTSEIPKENAVGPEDRMVGKWLAMGRKGRNRVSEKPGMYDYPGTNGRCSHELIPGTVVVHRLKRWEQWREVLRFFNVTRMLKPSKLYDI